MGGITALGSFISFLIKDKRRYLLVEGISSLFWAAMFLFMFFATDDNSQINLFIIGVYSALRALVFWWIFAKDTKRRRIAGRIFLIAMLIIAITVGIIQLVQLPSTQQIIMQTLVLTFALGFVIGQYMPGHHPLRISIFFYAIIMGMNSTPLVIGAYPGSELVGMERWNIIGMVIEGMKILSVLTFYGIMIYKHFLSRHLKKIKVLVNCEISKIKACSEISEISGLMPPEKLEALVAKMIKYELSVVNKDEIDNIRTTQERTQAVLEDMKTVSDVKVMLARMLELKEKRMSRMPLPKLSNVKTEMSEAMLGKIHLFAKVKPPTIQEEIEVLDYTKQENKKEEETTEEVVSELWDALLDETEKEELLHNENELSEEH